MGTGMKDDQLRTVIQVLEKSVEEWDTNKCPAVKAHLERMKREKGVEGEEDDFDNDGIPDDQDGDDDNDGIPDDQDEDDDNDGIPDDQDDDDDGDGLDDEDY